MAIPKRTAKVIQISSRRGHTEWLVDCSGKILYQDRRTAALASKVLRSLLGFKPELRAVDVRVGRGA